MNISIDLHVYKQLTWGCTNMLSTLGRVVIIISTDRFIMSLTDESQTLLDQLHIILAAVVNHL